MLSSDHCWTLTHSTQKKVQALSWLTFYLDCSTPLGGSVLPEFDDRLSQQLHRLPLFQSNCMPRQRGAPLINRHKVYGMGPRPNWKCEPYFFCDLLPSEPRLVPTVSNMCPNASLLGLCWVLALGSGTTSAVDHMHCSPALWKEAPEFAPENCMHTAKQHRRQNLFWV